MKFWKTVYRIATVIFVILVIVGLSSLFIPKIRQIRARQRVEAQMQTQAQAWEDATIQLRQQQERFVNDPSYVERIAREELGKAKPGETIFRLPDEARNETRRTPTP